MTSFHSRTFQRSPFCFASGKQLVTTRCGFLLFTVQKDLNLLRGAEKCAKVFPLEETACSQQTVCKRKDEWRRENLPLTAVLWCFWIVCCVCARLHSCLSSVNGFRLSARRPSATKLPTRCAYALVEIRQRGRTEERLTHLSTHFSFQKDKARSRREDGTPARNTDSFKQLVFFQLGDGVHSNTDMRRSCSEWGPEAVRFSCEPGKLSW